MQKFLLMTTAVAAAMLSQAAVADTIPLGAISGDTVYYPEDSSSSGSCPCGGEIGVGTTAGQPGTWTLDGGQAFSLLSGGISSPSAAPYFAVGRNPGAIGTVNFTGAGTIFSLSGGNTGATIQIGRAEGDGVVNVHDGATLNLWDSISTSADNDTAIHLGESGGTGTLDVDNGSVVQVKTGTGGAIYVGAHNATDLQVGGTGILNIDHGSLVALQDFNSPNPIGEDLGADLSIGQGPGTSGTVTIDNHSTLDIDSRDSYAGLTVGAKDGTIANMAVKNGSSVFVTANSVGALKGANESAVISVGKGDFSQGTLSFETGSQLVATGPSVYVGIGEGEGSQAELSLSGGSTFADNGWGADVQVGQWNPTADDNGIGKLSVSGAGTKFDITGSIYVGQGTGAGSSIGTIKVENGGEITANSVNLYKGATLTGNGGTINADVNLNAGGIISPGSSPGTMTINGNLTANSGKLDIQIGGTDPGLYDQLIVTGDLIATNPLDINVSFLNSFVPQIGDSFSFLQVLGIFDTPGDPFNIIFNGLPGSNFMLASSGGSFGFTTVAATPIPAALPLFASALGAVGFAGWRKRKAATAHETMT
jgi:hypothetical protein